MMNALWMGMVPDLTETRLLLLDGVRRTVLKARLSHPPSHPRSIPMLLEALALWEGRKIRAVLAADEPAASFGSRSWLADLEPCPESPLYELSFTPRSRPQWRPERLTGLGDFRELRTLLLEEVAR